MLDLNKVMIVGRLTRDPEVRYLPSGSAVASFDIAHNRRWRDRTSGEMMDETLFLPCKAWEQRAEFVQQYFTKGKAIYVEGRLQQETWERDGQRRSKILVLADRVQFAESRAEEEARRTGGGDRDSREPGPQPQRTGPTPDPDGEASNMPTMPGEDKAGGSTDDDLPF